MGVGGDRSVAVWHFPIYTSPTLTIDGNSGFQQLPAYLLGGVFYPFSLEIEGQNIATDETLTLTVGLHPTNAAGFSVGSIVFAAATAGTPSNAEKWPGDIATTLSGNIPMPPWFIAAHALAGTTKSMNYILYASGVLML